MKTEYLKEESFPQRDSTEYEEYAEALSIYLPEDMERGRELQSEHLMEMAVSPKNMEIAMKRVRANNGAPGADGKTVRETIEWMSDHYAEVQAEMMGGYYQVPLYEPQFSDNSFGYRPGRSGQQAIERVKEYAEAGYEWAVVLDLSKYFDTLNHDRLIRELRKTVKDEGNLSPLLANIYLNEFDMEYARRGVPEIRYADDIVLLARSKRAAERLLEGSCAYLEGKLKLKVNREKSRIVSLASNRGNFKFLGFNMGKGRNGKFHIYAHKKSKMKFKAKLKDLTSRKRPGTFQLICSELNRVVIGWLNYYGIAEMKKYRKLVHLGTPPKYAYMAANSRRGYWFTIHTGAVLRALSNEKLEGWGLVNLIKAYERIHSYPVQLQFMF